MTCTDCGKNQARVRGVCQTCYSRRIRNGTRDELPRPLKEYGRCLRGHAIEGDNRGTYANGKSVCIACRRERAREMRERQKAAKPPRAPKPNPQPKVETPKPKPVKAPKSKLPPGWDRVTPPKVHPKPGKAGSGMAKLMEVPPTPDTDPETLAKAARVLDLWFADAPEIAAELADALGLVAA